MTRRRSLDWAAPVDDGDGAMASRDIERWREGLPAPRPIEGVIAQLRERLQLLSMSPLVRNDVECAAILHGMRACRDVADFEAGVTRLQARVAALLRERAGWRRPSAPAAAPARPAAPELRHRPARAGAIAWRTRIEP